MSNDPWYPARNATEAKRMFAVKDEHLKIGQNLEHFIAAGWTIERLLDFGYIRAVPPMPAPAMPLWNPFEGAPAAGTEDDGARHEPSEITREVVSQIIARDAHGQRKYGVTLDRTDLSTSDWLQHMAEEMMDGAHYALAAKREIQRREEADKKHIEGALRHTYDLVETMLNGAESSVARRVLAVFTNKLHDRGTP